MAFVNFSNLTEDFTMGTEAIAYDGFGVVENGGVASYATAGSPFNDIELFGSASITGGVASGSVTQLQMDLSNNASTAPDVVFTNVNFGASILTSGTDEEIFETMVGGSSDAFIATSSNTADIRIYGDYENVINGEFREGGDDYFGFFGNTGGSFSFGPADFGASGVIAGDAQSVQSGGTIVGGNDEINGTFDIATGDAGFSSGTVFGGHDDITFANLASASNSDAVFGDVNLSSGNVFGGNDVITVASGVTANLTLIGDVGNSTGSNSLVSGGDDSITGGDGDDYIVGDIGALSGGFATGGNDELNGGAGNDTIYGDANSITGGTLTAGGNDTIRGQFGDDTIFAGSGDDFVDGGVDNDTIEGEAGNDTLFGSFGDDIVNGGSGADLIRGNDNNDTLDGGSGSDQIFGGTGIDIMNGGAGNDTLDGAGGFDTLNGGTGNDILTGGFNADTFIFEGNFGDDVITDFAFNNNNEKIDLSGVASIVDFGDLLNNHISNSAAGAVIDDGSGNTITLTGVSIINLDEGDFIF